MTKLTVRYKNERTLKQLLSHAEVGAKKWEDYGFIQDTTYWEAKVNDYNAQWYASYDEKEDVDKVNRL